MSFKHLSHKSKKNCYRLRTALKQAQFSIQNASVDIRQPEILLYEGRSVYARIPSDFFDKLERESTTEAQRKLAGKKLPFSL